MSKGEPKKVAAMSIIAEHFEHQPTKDVAEMCDCTIQYVQMLAKGMGLRKTPARRATASTTRFERYFT